MSEYPNEDRLGRASRIIGATAMCAAAMVPIALVAGTKHAPAYRGEDPTLIRSVSASDNIRAAVIAWAGVRR